MFLARKLISKKTYFLKSIRVLCFIFYIIYHSCLWSITPISELKSEEVFDSIEY